VFLRDVFKQNVFNHRQTHRVLNRHPNISQPDDKPDTVAFLPYVRTIFNLISRVLSRHNIKSVGLPPKKVSGFLRPVKDNLGLKTQGVYRIPCECGKVYVVQTGRSVESRLKEHQRHICLEQPYKSAVAEHSVDLGRHIQFHNTSVLATKTQHMDGIVKEVIEIELHRNSMSREMGFVSANHGSRSSAPSGNLTPDLQGHAGPCTLASLVPSLLCQCPPGRPSLSPPRHAPIPALACYLLYDVALPSHY
jgi:hypothetical protein